jgi:cytochrome c-type biogenesis protein CcmH/NrfG
MKITGIGLPMVLAGLAVAGCGKGAPDSQQQPAAAAETDTSVAGVMQRGVALLYQSNDPFGAEQNFREVLRRSPGHYGATYQLAAALDREGRPAEARPLWEQVKNNAEASKDEKTAATARDRLAAPDTVSQAGLMASGVHSLYTENNAAAASAQFRKVLERNPTHYGATYQLAVALDRDGKGAEARALWEKMLTMATQVKDEKTIAAVKLRLAQKP